MEEQEVCEFLLFQLTETPFSTVVKTNTNVYASSNKAKGSLHQKDEFREHRSGEPGDLGSKLFMVNQQGWSQLSVGVSMGMSYGPALPIPSLLLPGAEREQHSWPGQSPHPELRQHPSFPCFSDEYTHFTTNRIPAVTGPPLHGTYTQKCTPRSRGLTKSILPLKFYQKYPFHCFHHCKSHTYLYLSQRKYK